jgi:hypothetical protein
MKLLVMQFSPFTRHLIHMMVSKDTNLAGIYFEECSEIQYGQI